MKKKGFLFLLMASLLMATTFTSCEKENNNDNKTFNIVGEWSGIGDDEASIPLAINSSVDEQVRIHFSFKADGTCSITMPAWDERRSGTYTLNGNKLDITITKLEWVLPLNNGYLDV